jgi:chromate transporter
MSPFLVYVLLLKATLASFSGFGSLAQVREDLVVRHGVISDDSLNRAVLVARTTPGPVGVYVVSVGYMAAGAGGAVAGWLAMATPALLVVPLAAGAHRLVDRPRVRNAIDGLVLASAILIVLTGVSLVRDVVARL